MVIHGYFIRKCLVAVIKIKFKNAFTCLVTDNILHVVAYHVFIPERFEALHAGLS